TTEIVVSDYTPYHTEPHFFKSHFSIVFYKRTIRTYVNFKRFRMLSRYLIVERVYSLKNNYLMWPKPERARNGRSPLLACEHKMRYLDLSALCQNIKVLIEQFHIDTFRRFIVNVPIGSSRRSFRIYGLKIVVNGHCM